MRNALVRRTVLAASAVSLTLLATACGSDKADTKADAKPSEAAATSAAPAAKAKTTAELAGVLVVQADLPNHVVKAATPAELAAASATKSDKPECQPLVSAQSMAPIGTAAGTAGTKAVAKGKEPAADASPEEKLKAGLAALSATATSVSLHSYEGTGAAEALATIKKAGTACAGGYTGGQGGDSLKITKVAPGAAVTAGDEALAYTVTGDADGEPMSMELVVVRKGSTVATFSALSLAGAAEQPKDVVDAQVKKLG
ncbi:hypothetical protein [Streptomyces nojiriensis]|uniref:Lipoprotein n=1 Tax=Streptomyces nojiriensis TaxID=66374 RepID=A0ABQ3T083_9ACTN|nr:hypothetical protein [Streptomyces nojiriensis]QTI47287.1 hypothetical protein JYK04_05136 [Streptomyces nojiriensis]GGR79485.1 lipoprotein [Streptomyces nojiriensis]GHI73781.1 lipoprotein [Streptomyces nojiriensis]